MIGEIIAIGDELTSGRILNSTSYFAASHLFAAGHEIAAMSTIGDTQEMIGTAIKRAIARADFVVVTGGLGPTSDDMTTEAVADALNRPTTFYPEIFERVRNSSAFASMPSLEKLAWLPSGAEVLKPGEKMAGYLLIDQEKPIFFLPGIPHQMRELMLDRVIPRLEAWSGDHEVLVRQKVYKVLGLEESHIHERLAELEKQGEFLRIGYYPMAAEVHVSLTLRGDSPADVERAFAEYEAEIRRALGSYIYDEAGDSMEEIVGSLLAGKKLTLGLAESCTGGLIAHRLTSVPGSSDYFRGGLVAYANEVKGRMLGVRDETLLSQGAVSRQTALEMARGARQALGVDLALAVTGIAGPGGGTADKPVGTVWFALAGPDSGQAFLCRFRGRRQMVQTVAAMRGLDIIRRYLLDLPLPAGEPL